MLCIVLLFILCILTALALVVTVFDIVRNCKRNWIFSSYPCEKYLHNALHFMKDGFYEVAYDEICNCICKSRGELTEDEENIRRTLFSKHSKLKSSKPKSPICNDNPGGICPNCGNVVTRAWHERYCGDCGQELDWGTDKRECSGGHDKED